MVVVSDVMREVFKIRRNWWGCSGYCITRIVEHGGKKANAIIGMQRR